MIRIIICSSMFLSAISMAAISDGTWQVTEKYCDTRQLQIAGNERVVLNNINFAHIFLLSEDQNQSCYQAQTFQRNIESFSNDMTKYLETATLLPQFSRTICRNKNTGRLISDATISLDSPDNFFQLSIFNNKGTGDIKNSFFCRNGTLHVILAKE